jgi:hypothetical protein
VRAAHIPGAYYPILTGALAVSASSGHLLMYNCEMEKDDSEIAPEEKVTRVVSVEPAENFRLWVGLSNGGKGIFDVYPYIDKGVFAELKDPAYFSRVRVAFGGIVWPHGQDFSAGTVEYELQKDGDRISKGGR